MCLMRKLSAVTLASVRKGAWEFGNKLSVNKYSAILEESNVGRRAGSVCQASQWKTQAVKVQKIL